MASITTRAGKGSPLTNAELDANFTNLNTELLGKQDTLVSGTNIKTVNGQSILGSGNIVVSGGLTSFNTRTGDITLLSADVTTALGYTPYNSTNPSGYITSSALSSYLPLTGGALTGNLAVNATLYAWGANYKALQVGATTALVDSSSYTTLQSNYTVNGGGVPIYQTTAPASFYQQNGGVHSWFSAPSGTAGTAVSFSSASMTLNASGELTITNKLTVGTTTTASTNYRFGKGITGGVSSSAFVQNGSVQSDVTTTAVSFNSQANTAAASFTLANYFHYYAQQGVVGAGSAITAITGFYADNTLAGASATYGFRGSVGSGSGKWNLYMDGTASNFFAGSLIVNAAVGFGAAGSPAYGTAGQALLSGGNGVVPSWGDVVTPTGTQTLTNKRVTSRTVTTSGGATITPTADTADVYAVNGLASAASIAAPSGTPTDGQKLMLRFEDNGTARALTWATTSGAFRAVGVTLPTTTTAGKTTYVGCVYNAFDSFWDAVAVATLA